MYTTTTRGLEATGSAKEAEAVPSAGGKGEVPRAASRSYTGFTKSFNRGIPGLRR